MSKQLQALPESAIDGQLFAAIDLGSNSFHLLIAQYVHGSLQVVDRLKEMVRLAEGVHKSGELDELVNQRALTCLARFGQRIASIPTENIRAVGTNAFRRLKDGWRFLAEAESQLGHTIEIISGQEEARLIYVGVAHGISEKGRQRLVIDIGGGSTEFIIGSEFNPIRLSSLYFGCVSISQRFFKHGKITLKNWQKAKTAVEVELQSITEKYCKSGWEEVLGSSGTMRSVREVMVANGWSERGITQEGIQILKQHLFDFGQIEDIDLIGLSERRRPVFASGVVIIEACMSLLNIEQIIVAEYALREGLLYEMVGRLLEDDLRQTTISGLLEKYRIDISQANRVSKLALKLWKQLAKTWELPKASKDWLLWAAHLHEIGLTISYHGYHRHGAYLIEHSDLPGFSKLEQSILAKLILLHRRKPATHTVDELVSRAQTPTRLIAALLRIAVALYRTRTEDKLPQFEINADRSYSLQLQFPADWLAQHPLTYADLKQEQSQLKKLDVDLTIQ